MTNQNLAKAYATFRGSRTFLFGLIGICAFWLFLHFYLNVDSDFGMMNLFLSFEASVSLAFFAMVGDSQNAEQQQTLNAIKMLEERILNAINQDKADE
jgi:uncharacterized membrane protein